MKRLLLFFFLAMAGTLLNVRADPSTGVVACWKFDESSGNAADSVGSNTLTNFNAATFVSGLVNNATHLTASSSQYFSHADTTALRFGTPFTLSVWVNSDGATGQQQTIVSKFNGSLEFELSFDQSAGQFRARIFGGSGSVDLHSGDSVFASTWYNIVVTNDGTNLTIRQNDGTVYSASSSGLGTVGGSSEFTVGESNYAGNSFALYWNGKIDELGKWNRVLTSGEITQIYNSGAGLACPYSAGASPTPTATATATVGPTATATATSTPTATATATFTPTPTATATATPPVTLDDSYDCPANQDQDAVVDSTTFDAAGQRYTSTGGTLAQITFYVKKTGSPTGNAVAKVYAISGGVPTGTALATSDPLNVTTLSTSYALTNFTFSGVNQVTLVNGTQYGIVVEYTGGNGSNFLSIGLDNSTSTHSGAYINHIAGLFWASHSGDVCFYVYVAGGGATPTPTVTPTATPVAPNNWFMFFPQ